MEKSPEMKLVNLVFKYLGRIPVVKRIVRRVFDMEDPRVQGMKELGNSQETLIDEMAENTDSTREMIDSITDIEQEFRVGDLEISKNIRRKGPFEE